MKKMLKNHRSDYSDVIGAITMSSEDFELNTELELQLEREKKSASEYPEFYRLADMMSSPEGNHYRSGESGGACYMTNDDLTRIILERTRIPQYVKGGAASENVVSRPAAPYTVRESGKALVGAAFTDSVCENVFDGREYGVARIERADTNLLGALIRMKEQWIPSHTLQRQSRLHRRQLGSPAAGIAWAMIFVLVLALPITLGVLKSEAVSNLNVKKQELIALERTEAELRAEFESSLDFRYIESVAVNEIGMIKLNDSTVKVLKLNDFDSIESFTDKRSNPVVPALLSALGIRAGDE